MLRVSVLSSIFATVADFVTDLAKDCVLSESLYTDDLVMISESFAGFRNKFV